MNMIRLKNIRSVLAVAALVLVSGALARAAGPEPGRLGPVFSVDDRGAIADSVAAAPDGSFTVAYLAFGGVGVFLRRYDSAGNALDEPRPVAEPAIQALGAAYQGIAVNAQGAFSIVWLDGTVNAIYVRSFAADGTPRGPSILVDPHADRRRQLGRPAVTVDGSGRTLVSWVRTTVQYDIDLGIPGCGPPFPCPSVIADRDINNLLVRRFDIGGTASPETTVARVITKGNNVRLDMNTLGTPSIVSGPQDSFAIGWTQSHYFGVLTFQSRCDASLFVRPFGANLVPAGDARAIRTVAPAACGGVAQPSDPSLAASAGGYALSWSEFSSSTPDRIYLQSLTAGAVPQGSLVTVPIDGCDDAFAARVASNATGTAVVTWNCFNFGSFLSSIRAYRFAANGAAKGGIVVATARPRPDDQQLSGASVAMDGAGRFVSVWSEYNYINDGRNNTSFVRGQRFADR